MCIDARRRNACMSSSATLPVERRAHQPEESLRVGWVLESQGPDGPVGWQEPGAEDQVPHDDGVPVVRVGLARFARMMPPVRFGAADDVVEEAVAQTDVAVLKKTVGRVREVVEGERSGVDSQEQEWETVEAHLQRLLDRVEARGVEPVQLIDGVMHGVEAP